MKRIKVKSVDHLRELIEQGIHSFVALYGILRCSRYITLDSEGNFMVFSDVDGSEVPYTAEELSTDYYPIGKAIINGNFYGEQN